ncbi:MAG: EthD domain-containing protein [SAR324 cluster bacterium]|nr:EthD domain-containing protein [SAR324 cluster bacterium]
MIKLSYFIHRLPSLSPQDFHSHWRNQHAALIVKHASVFGIRRYVQLHATEHPSNLPTEAFPEPYDGVAELWFAAEAQLEQWFANSTPQAIAAGKEIRADERRFIDRARSPFLLGEELPVISGA